VGYGLKVRRVPAAERRTEVARLLDMVGLTELAERRVDRISGGQRQRVALARAIAIKPRVLLLDEPLAALDASLRERLRLEIAALLRAFRITAVYVTHDQSEAMAIGDRIAVMNRGRIVQLDVPEAIYRRPTSRFAAEFVGTMNRIEGQVRDGVLRLGAGAISVGGPDRYAILWFRPEAVRLADAGRAALRGQVCEATFFGPVRRLKIEIGADLPVLVDAPSNQPLPTDGTIGLDIPVNALVELPDEPLA
jgi:putative spermidine/putrescine transport system ATP-binding protein